MSNELRGADGKFSKKFSSLAECRVPRGYTALIDRAAKRNFLSRSEWMRRAICEQLKIDGIDFDPVTIMREARIKL